MRLTDIRPSCLTSKRYLNLTVTTSGGARRMVVYHSVSRYSHSNSHAGSKLEFSDSKLEFSGSMLEFSGSKLEFSDSKLELSGSKLETRWLATLLMETSVCPVTIYHNNTCLLYT